MCDSEAIISQQYSLSLSWWATLLDTMTHVITAQNVEIGAYEVVEKILFESKHPLYEKVSANKGQTGSFARRNLLMLR